MTNKVSAKKRSEYLKHLKKISAGISNIDYRRDSLGFSCYSAWNLSYEELLTSRPKMVNFYSKHTDMFCDPRRQQQYFVIFVNIFI